MNGMDSCSVGVDDRDRSRNFDGLQKVRESIDDVEGSGTLVKNKGHENMSFRDIRYIQLP